MPPTKETPSDTPAAPSAAPPKATAVRLREAVMFPGRSALTQLQAQPSRNPGLSVDSGGFEFRLGAFGVEVVDPKGKARTLVPWGNVASVQLSES